MILIHLTAQCDYCEVSLQYQTSFTYVQPDEDGNIVCTDLPDYWKFDNVTGDVTCPKCDKEKYAGR